MTDNDRQVSVAELMPPWEIRGPGCFKRQTYSHLMVKGHSAPKSVDSQVHKESSYSMIKKEKCQKHIAIMNWCILNSNHQEKVILAQREIYKSMMILEILICRTKNIRQIKRKQ